MSVGSRISELQLALMLLTRLPAGRLKDPAPELEDASWAFPFVGLIVGAIGWAALSLSLWLGASVLIGAIAAVTAMTLATGALHLDGLADFADGIGGGRDRAHCLEIMRDSRIGSYGVIALILVIAFKIAAISETAAAPALAVFLFLGAGSRLAMLALLVWLPPARPDGLGSKATGASFKSLLPGAAVICALLPVLGGAGFGIVVAISLFAAGVAWFAVRRIQGQTGDVLGASQSVSEAAGWIVASALLA